MAGSLNTIKLYRLLDHDFRVWEVENLIKNGAEVNKLLDDGFSCFHKVVGISQVSEKYVLPLVSLMLDYSGDPNIKSVHGLTAVHIAAMWGRVAVLELLIENCGDPYLCDNNGKNAFTLSLENNELEALKLLQEKVASGLFESCSASNSDCDRNRALSSSLDEISDDYLASGILSKNFRLLTVGDDSDDSGMISATPLLCNRSCASERSSTVRNEFSSSTLNDALLESGSDISQVESVHQDPETGAELIEKRASSEPTIITIDTSALNDSQATEIYNWRDYRADSLRLSVGTMQNLNKEALSALPEYSKDLELYLRGSIHLHDVNELEAVFREEFEFPNPSKHWREGIHKSSFNYMLLDPRHTKNLPHRSHLLTELESLNIFISAIFYIGKGKHSRPYSHLYDAMNKAKLKKGVSDKESHILDIWSSGNGVVSLHCFQNVIPVEAYTREAMMIDCISLQNLTNIRKGDFYGQSVKWPESKRRKLGTYFLVKAMKIFLIEGEKQLYPVNLK